MASWGGIYQKQNGCLCKQKLSAIFGCLVSPIFSNNRSDAYVTIFSYARNTKLPEIPNYQKWKIPKIEITKNGKYQKWKYQKWKIPKMKIPKLENTKNTNFQN